MSRGNTLPAFLVLNSYAIVIITLKALDAYQKKLYYG